MANDMKMFGHAATRAKMVAGFPMAGGICTSGSGGVVLGMLS